MPYAFIDPKQAVKNAEVNPMAVTLDSQLSTLNSQAPLADPAYTGLAGEIVRALEPYTEADPVALLLSLLVSFGNLLGHGPHFAAEAIRHHLNLYCVLVGPTADSRKGASWCQIRRIFETVDLEWVAWCVRHGLTSGEGLLHTVRDKITIRQTAWKDGSPYGSQPVTTDYGEKEKRLMVVEEDFAPALRRLSRRGSTLSFVLRAAWDRGDLHLLTRSRATRASSAHLSIIAHTTPEELLSSLPPSEIAGGFANRFLWACVHRSKCLPDGDPLPAEDVHAFAKRISEAAAAAREVDRISRDKEALALWREIYPGLSQARLGTVGAVLARSAPQVMRLACLYALLDGCDQVTRPHLEAALALWEYCHDSARQLFAQASPPTLPDRLLSALRQSHQGLTRREIAHSAGHHHAAADISAALRSLAAQGLAASRREEGGGGRPAERWFAVAEGGGA
jgi:hypothetical protein